MFNFWNKKQKTKDQTSYYYLSKVHAQLWEYILKKKKLSRYIFNRILNFVNLLLTWCEMHKNHFLLFSLLKKDWVIHHDVVTRFLCCIQWWNGPYLFTLLSSSFTLSLHSISSVQTQAPNKLLKCCLFVLSSARKF